MRRQESLDGMENLSDADVTAALQGRIDTLESGFSPMLADAMAVGNAAGGCLEQMPIRTAQGCGGSDQRRRRQ